MTYTRPFTVDQVARMLRCTDKTVRERAVELGGLKVGRDWVFPAGAFFARLDALALAAAEAGPVVSPPSSRLAVLQGGPGVRKRRPPPALPQLVDGSR